VIDRSKLSDELRKAKGRWQLFDSSAAYRFEIPDMSLQRVVQGFQIGGAGHRLRRRIPACATSSSSALNFSRRGTLPSSPGSRSNIWMEATMHGIIYLVGLIVVVLAILSFFGLR
jgi:hypothetical protein